MPTKPAAFTLPPVPGMLGIDERIRDLLDMRPTQGRPLVHQDDPAAVDQALGQAVNYGMIAANFATNPLMATLQAILGGKGMRPGDPARLQRLGLSPEDAAIVADPNNWLMGEMPSGMQGKLRAVEVPRLTPEGVPIKGLKDIVYYAGDQRIGVGTIGGDLIHSIQVHPEFQRRGYGMEILRDMERRGGTAATAGTDEGASLLKAAGWQPESKDSAEFTRKIIK